MTVILRFAAKGAAASAAGASLGSQSAPSSLPSSSSAFLSLIDKALRAVRDMCRHGAEENTANAENISAFGEAGACQGKPV